MTPDEYETMLVKKDLNELIVFFMNEDLLVKERMCIYCNRYMVLKRFSTIKDGVCWRCTNITCPKYRTRTSIRSNSFFDTFNTDLLTIMKILIRWSADQPQHSIKKNLDIADKIIRKTINKFIKKAGGNDFSINKLGGGSKIVQIDETMLNYKCKSHRGRSPKNRTDALCIVEYDNKIIRGFAQVIANKESATLIPIICRNVVSGTKIWTDEHKSYNKLSDVGFFHDSVCHKYFFVNKDSGTNTQAVESFNNALKLEIKRRKGIKTELRQAFLDEFVWLFNNKDNRLEKILCILKVYNGRS